MLQLIEKSMPETKIAKKCHEQATKKQDWSFWAGLRPNKGIRSMRVVLKYRKPKQRKRRQLAVCLSDFEITGNGGQMKTY